MQDLQGQLPRQPDSYHEKNRNFPRALDSRALRHKVESNETVAHEIFILEHYDGRSAGRPAWDEGRECEIALTLA